MQVSTSQAKDVVAGRLVCQFKDTDGKWSRFTAGRFCSEVVLSSGESPSYALVSMPMNSFGPGAYDEVAPACALQTRGPAGQIKLKTRATISYLENNYSATLMHGWVVTHTHQLDEDSIVTQIYDDRWVLGKYTVSGRMTYDPTTSRHYWDWIPPVFNDLGFPNCIDTPYGPRFAPCHRFGFSNNMTAQQAIVENYDEPAPGYATARARSWRCQDIFRYLRDQFAPASGGMRAPCKVYLGVMDLPDNIVWSEALGTVFGSDRTPKNFSLHNASLLQALQAVARKAGAYDLYIEPSDNDKSTLKLLNMNPRTFTGTTLYTAAYAASHVGQCMNDGAIVKGGSVTESFVDGFDEVVICGDKPVVERMCSTYSGGVGAGYLEYAWSSGIGGDENAFTTYLQTYGGAALGDEDSFRSASKIWPLVFAAYRVTVDADLWEGTKWAGMKNDGRARMLVAQLTGYSQDASNPRNWTPREIVVEYLKIFADEDTSDPDPDDPEWFEAAKFDNLTLSSDSTIVFLNALREPGVAQTWYVNADGSLGGYDGSKMYARNMRIQLALQADWPLTGVKGNGGDKSDDPNRIAGRVADKPRFSFQVNAEEMDYVEYLRSDQSRPVGAALLDKLNDGRSQSAFPAKQTEGDELFTDRTNASTGRLPRHADLRNQDVKRVDIHATLNIEPVSLGMRPGLNLSVEAGDSIPIVGVCKTVIFRAEAFGEEGQTTVIMGPPDSAAIYDPPTSARSRSVFNSGSSKSTGGDPYKDPGYGSGSGNTSSSSGYTEPKPSGGSPSESYAPGAKTVAPSVTSDNDSDANNQAIRNNSTADQNMGSTGVLQKSGGGDDGVALLFAQRPGSGSGGAAGAAGAAKSGGTIRNAEQIAAGDAEASVGSSGKRIFTGDSLKARDDDRRMKVQETYRTSGNKDTPMARGLMAGERNAASTSKHNVMGEMGPIVGRAKTPNSNVGGVSLTPQARAVQANAQKSSTNLLSNALSGNLPRQPRSKPAVEQLDDE